MSNSAASTVSAPQPNDTELIRQIRAGNRQAFTTLTKKYEEKVFALAIKITGNVADAQEIAQDVFLTVYQKLDGFRGESAFSSWLYRVTANEAFMKLRDRRKHQASAYDGIESGEDRLPSVVAPIDPTALADVQLENIEVGARLQEAVAQLPTPFKLVYMLKENEELTNEEVGQALNLSVAATKSRLHRARRFLHGRLQPYKEGTV